MTRKTQLDWVLLLAAAVVVLGGAVAAAVDGSVERRLGHMELERTGALVEAGSGVESDAVIQNMLLTLMAALDKFKYKYWMVWGTLLGVVRDKGIIPGDHDADLGMMKSHFDYLPDDNKLSAYLRKAGYILTKSRQNVMKLYKESELLANGHSKAKLYSAYCDKCTNIDIFPFESKDGCLVRDCFYSDWSQPCEPEYCQTSSIPLSYHKKTTQIWVKAFKRYVPIPEKPKEWLQYYYRDWWVPHKDGTKGSKSRLPGCMAGRPATPLEDAPLAK